MPSLVRRRDPVDRGLLGRAPRERHLGVRQEPRARIAPGPPRAEAKRLGEAPEELLRRVRAAVPERGPALVPRQRREDVQQRGARSGGKPARLGDGRDQVHGVPGDGRGER